VAKLIVCLRNFANDPNEFALNTFTYKYTYECTTHLFSSILIGFVERNLLIISRVRFVVNRVGVSFFV